VRHQLAATMPPPQTRGTRGDCLEPRTAGGRTPGRRQHRVVDSCASPALLPAPPRASGLARNLFPLLRRKPPRACLAAALRAKPTERCSKRVLSTVRHERPDVRQQHRAGRRSLAHRADHFGSARFGGDAFPVTHRTGPADEFERRTGVRHRPIISKCLPGKECRCNNACPGMDIAPGTQIEGGAGRRRRL
jgi:hypothetical protein